MARETRPDLRTDDNEVKVAEIISPTASQRDIERFADDYRTRVLEVVSPSVALEVVTEASEANLSAYDHSVKQTMLADYNQILSENPNNEAVKGHYDAFVDEFKLSEQRLDGAFNKMANNFAPEELAAYKKEVLNEYRDYGSEAGQVLPSPAILAPGNQLKPGGM